MVSESELLKPIHGYPINAGLFSLAFFYIKSAYDNFLAKHMKTLYALLEISPDATQSEIEQGYKRRLEHYLSRQGIAKSDLQMRRMQAVREAYLLLCSPPRRRAYDLQLKVKREAKPQFAIPGTLMRVMLVMAIVLMLGAGAYLFRAHTRFPSAGARELSGESTSPHAARELLAMQSRVARAN